MKSSTYSRVYRSQPEGDALRVNVETTKQEGTNISQTVTVEIVAPDWPERSAATTAAQLRGGGWEVDLRQLKNGDWAIDASKEDDADITE